MVEPSMAHRFKIQTMTRDQVSFAIKLAANEGWNSGLHDVSCFYNTDPYGFLSASWTAARSAASPQFRTTLHLEALHLVLLAVTLLCQNTGG
jgi:hypothetical protein